MQPSAELTIDLPSMSNLNNLDGEFIVIIRIDDPVISASNQIFVCS